MHVAAQHIARKGVEAGVGGLRALDGGLNEKFVHWTNSVHAPISDGGGKKTTAEAVVEIFAVVTVVVVAARANVVADGVARSFPPSSKPCCR